MRNTLIPGKTSRKTSSPENIYFPLFYVFTAILGLVLFATACIWIRLLNEENHRADHELQMALLSEQIDQSIAYRFQVIQALSINRQVTDVLEGKSVLDNAEIRLALNTANEIAHSELIWIMNEKGIVRSSSDFKGRTLTGTDYSFRPYFISSITGKTDIFPAVGAVTQTKGLYLSMPIQLKGKKHPLGVIAIKINIQEIEALLQASDKITALVSPDGVIFSASRPDWIFHTLLPLSRQTLSRFRSTKQFGGHPLPELALDLNGEEIFLDKKRYQIFKQPLQISGWKIISCCPGSSDFSLTDLQKIIIGTTVGVTGSLAVLVFFLLINIHRRRKIETKLRQAKKKYYSIFQNAIVGIYQSTAEGRFLEASPSIARILGYETPEELIRTITSIETQVYVDPEDYREFNRLLFKNSRYEGFQTRFYKKDGREIWVSLSARVVRDRHGFIDFLEGFSVDITKRKEAQEALRREHDITARIMETSPVGITLVNEAGRITFANTKAEQILGIPASEITQLRYSDPRWKISDFGGRPFPQENLPFSVVRRTALPVQDIRYAIRRNDGNRALVSINSAPIFDQSGSVAGMVSTIEDITQKVAAENEAQLHLQQLIHADRMISLGILVSGIAHEINNPNTFIMSNAYLFADAWKQSQTILDEYYAENGDFLIGGIAFSHFREKVPTLCDRIIEGSRRIKTIVREMRHYSRDNTDMAFRAVNLNDVFKSARILLSNMIRKSTNHFQVDLEESLPSIRGSFQQMEQVVINIIQNACQALSGAEESIHIQTFFDSRTNRVSLVCKDQGEGIPEKSIDYLTDPFFTTKRDTGGTGLGLSISAKIVSEHKGQISFDSEVGGGTTVTLCFPAGNDTDGSDGNPRVSGDTA